VNVADKSKTSKANSIPNYNMKTRDLAAGPKHRKIKVYTGDTKNE
jgi:hypothetical protein